MYITRGCNFPWDSSLWNASPLSCEMVLDLNTNAGDWAGAPMGLERFLGQSGASRMPGGGREGGEARLMAQQSRHGWNETNQVLNCCWAGSPGEKDWCGSAWWTLLTARMGGSMLVWASFLCRVSVCWACSSTLLAVWPGLPFSLPVGVPPAPWGVLGIIAEMRQVF